MALKAGYNGQKKKTMKSIEERLAALEDLFNIEDPEDDQILVYDETAGAFVNTDPS